jgi:hypothetical protein
MAEDIYSPLVQDQKLLNEVKFAARDFASMADDLLRRLKIEYGDVYNDYASTSQGIMLRDLVAWAYAGLTWYLDRTASDCYLATARTREAVERIVEQIAYKMTPAAASVGTLLLTFDDGTPQGFEMNDRWRYISKSGLSFESYAKHTEPLALSPGSQFTMDVRQGETRIVTYTANGRKNQTYRLSSIDATRYLGVHTTDVWVDGQLWVENDFLEFDKTPQYEISYLANPPIVRFGDGTAGNIPPAGAEIKIRYLIIDGQKGNVTADTIQTSVDQLIIAGETINFTVTNPERTRGGTEPEEAARAKRWAPGSFAARGAAITQQDYEALSNSFVSPAFGAVAKAYAVNPRSSYDDVVFDELISDIEALLSAFNTQVSSLEDTVNANAALMSSSMTIITSATTSLESMRGDLYSWSGSAMAAVVNSRSSCVEASSRSDSAYSQADSAATATQDLIDAINGGTVTVMSEVLAALSPILAWENGAKSESSVARTSALVAQGAIEAAIPFLDSLVEATEDGGDMETYIQTINDELTTMSGLIAAIQSDLSTIDGAASALEDAILAIMNGSPSVEENMRSRIAFLFSDDCLSNYVQVPILSLDLDGNYVAPSIGLRTALQQYLNGIKEVTQVVEVVDGSPILVPAEIAIRVAILSAYVPAEVRSQIQSIIVGMLKGRDFNQPLYLDAMYEAVRTVAGIYYVNISITGPNVVPSVIDSEGNLVPASNQVIVYGSLGITVTNQNGEVL